MANNKKPYGGYLAIVSILLILAAVCAIALGVLGYLGILISLDLWMVIACGVVAVLSLAIWVWFLCVVSGIRKKSK